MCVCVTYGILFSMILAMASKKATFAQVEAKKAAVERILTL